MSKNFFAPGEDNAKEDSLNNYLYLFSEYQNTPPDLDEALKHIFISSGLSEEKSNKYKEQIKNDSKRVVEDNFEKIKKKYPDISFDDAQIISSYTCEAEDRDYSPYKLLNSNLVSQNRKAGVEKVSKYLYILLLTLKKLPRYYLDEKTKYLYRCITTKVSQKYDPFKPEFVPYVRDPNNPDKTKTFWAFTSCSPKIDLTLTFLNNEKNIENKEIKSGTIFTLTGKIWGYDITFFNFYHETEILLEPERKYKIEEALPEINDIIRIRCEIIETPEILLDSKKIFVKYGENKWAVTVKNSDTRKEVLNYLIENFNLDYDDYAGIGIFLKNYNSIFRIGRQSKDGDEYELKIFSFFGEIHNSEIEKEVRDIESFYVYVKLDKTLSLSVNPYNTIAYLKYLIEKNSKTPYEFLKLSGISYFNPYGDSDNKTLGDCYLIPRRKVDLFAHVGSDCYFK